MTCRHLLSCCIILLLLLFIHSTLTQAQPRHPLATPSKKWLTLTGRQPSIIARGGYSGLFPESSGSAYQFATSTSLDGLFQLCDLQFTKDARGICLSSFQLDNTTTIQDAYPNSRKTYNVNGRQVTGWFALDFTFDQLYKDVSLIQNIFSRPNAFDGMEPISALQDLASLKNTRIWLNVQFNSFYVQQKLNPLLYLDKVMRLLPINFISSPEIGFLRAVKPKVMIGKTKVIFRFEKKTDVEPTTKLTYGSLVNNLVMVKGFATGILVPKNYIWPVGNDMYLQPATTLVADAHKQGLEIYAYSFANDYPTSYNYSYDPTNEYLKFIDNNQFCVDGMLTDFPSTASEAIACLAGNKMATRVAGPLIISHNGASGVYAPCTDLAYQQAIADGVDIIDCSVQMSKDGVAFCLDSADLTGTTTALATFMQRSTMIPEIQNQNGIFTFDLTWSEIQTLKPQLSSPYIESSLERNPAEKNKGSFITLSAFLDTAKTKAVKGVLIKIQNAAFLVSKRSLSITDAVSAALSKVAFDKQRVLIQSDDSQVLAKFKGNTNYEKVLLIKEEISSAPKATVDEIKKYATAVTVYRSSIVKMTDSFAASYTSLIDDLHAANISVYVYLLRNEFVAIAFDYFSDPMVELATYIVSAGVDGVFTDFPATANAYLRSPCANPDRVPFSILPAEPGSLLQLSQPGILPPAEAPAPALTVADVVDPPLPDLQSLPPTGLASGPQPSSSSRRKSSSSWRLSSLFLIAVISLFSLCS